MKPKVFFLVKLNEAAQQAFNILKQKVTKVLVFSFPKFNLVFKAECDTSGVGSRVVLTQEGKLIAYFGENFNESRKKYSTYDNEFYVIVTSLNHWSLYNEFHAKESPSCN